MPLGSGQHFAEIPLELAIVVRVDSGKDLGPDELETLTKALVPLERLTE